MDTSTSHLAKSSCPPLVHDQNIFTRFTTSFTQECVSSTSAKGTNSFPTYTGYNPSVYAYNNTAQIEIRSNGNGSIEGPAPPKGGCSRPDQPWGYTTQPQQVRGPLERSNMVESYRNGVPEPTHDGYQHLTTLQSVPMYEYPLAFNGTNGGETNNHAGYSVPSQPTYAHPQTTDQMPLVKESQNIMPYYSNSQHMPPESQHFFQEPPLSYSGQWIQQCPTHSTMMIPQSQNFLPQYPQTPFRRQFAPPAKAPVGSTSNATRNKRGRKPKATAGDGRGRARVATQRMSSSQNICIICEERSVDMVVMNLRICQYCLIDYKNTIHLNLLEDCKCSMRHKPQHKISSCWRCVASKCLANGVDKEAVKAAKLSGNAPPDLTTILQSIAPYPEQANTFTPRIDFPLASRPFPESASLIPVLKDENILANCYFESGVNFTVWARAIPLIPSFTPQEQLQILKSGFLPVLLVCFAFQLAQFLPKSRAPAEQLTQEKNASLVDELFCPKEYLFSLEEMQAVKQSMTSNECQFSLYLCSADHQLSDNKESDESIELNRLGISQRYNLRQVFKFGEYFQDLKFSDYAFQCLCMVLLYENEKPDIPDELKQKMKQPLKEAQNYFRVALRQLNVADAEYLRMVSTQREILHLAEELRTTVGRDFKIPSRNIEGLYSVITQALS